MESITRAIIIAAGEGRRLRPLTEQIPKPLVKVNGVRIIDTSIQALKQNGIHSIYIVTGYKKEQFEELYQDDPDITILVNPDYQKGNNITSMYVARDYLPNSFVVEGDIMIRDPELFRPSIDCSSYCMTWMQDVPVPEWAVRLKDGYVSSCKINGGRNAFRLYGISMWTREDGLRLGKMIREYMENGEDRSIYWDEIALRLQLQQFKLGVRQISDQDVFEIDTLQELATLDPGYRSWL